jgi:hypothetical protein
VRKVTLLKSQRRKDFIKRGDNPWGIDSIGCYLNVSGSEGLLSQKMFSWSLLKIEIASKALEVTRRAKGRSQQHQRHNSVRKKCWKDSSSKDFKTTFRGIKTDT